MCCGTTRHDEVRRVCVCRGNLEKYAVPTTHVIRVALFLIVTLNGLLVNQENKNRIWNLDLAQLCFGHVIIFVSITAKYGLDSRPTRQ